MVDYANRFPAVRFAKVDVQRLVSEEYASVICQKLRAGHLSYRFPIQIAVALVKVALGPQSLRLIKLPHIDFK